MTSPTAAYLVKIALAGALGGAALVPAVTFLAIKANYKGLRTAYAGIPQNALFYKAWAIFGGVVGGAMMLAMPLLDAAEVKDPWYGLVLIAICLVPLIAVTRFLRRTRLGKQ